MKKRLTVGLFMDSYFPMIDGVTMVMDNYAKRLGKYGDVIVFVPDISKGTLREGIREEISCNARRGRSKV